MKNQKKLFTSVEKTAAENFSKIYRKAPEQESHFNKISYLKPASLLKKETPTQMFYIVLFKIFQDSYFY